MIKNCEGWEGPPDNGDYHSLDSSSYPEHPGHCDQLWAAFGLDGPSVKQLSCEIDDWLNGLLDEYDYAGYAAEGRLDECLLMKGTPSEIWQDFTGKPVPEPQFPIDEAAGLWEWLTAGRNSPT
jgi:hypothetical protein